MIGGAVALVPWVLYVSLTLPVQYEVHNWRYTWVGFDLFLAALMALTAYCGWRRKQVVMPLSFATGVLLACDAWFDVMTAAPAERGGSLLSAGLLEWPLAFVMIAGSLRLLRGGTAQLSPRRGRLAVEPQYSCRLGGADAPSLRRVRMAQ